MKSTSLLFLILCLSAVCRGQEYLPIVKEGAKWVQSGAWGAPPDPVFWEYWEYEIVGDTVINTVEYKKVYKGSVDGSQEYYGGIREDSGRVYFVQVYDSIVGYGNWCTGTFNPQFDTLITDQEFLLYDFNLSIGDSLYTNVHSEYNPVVYNVDSIDIGDGIMRKRLWMQQMGLDEWIEGIGNVRKGLLEGICWVFENDYYLACYVDSSISYPWSCNLNISDYEVPPDNLITYPNPTNSTIGFRLQANGGVKKIEIIGIEGKTLQPNWTSNSTSFEVNVTTLKPGLYLLRVITEDGTSVSRFIKQ